jgi:DNA-binding winged helix-turn-helix (wHTH) protein
MQRAELDFYRGNYSSEDWVQQIGAHVFKGDLLEATSLYERHIEDKNNSITDFIEARFYLGIGLVRTSQYTKASRIFASNLNEFKKISNKNRYWKTAFFAYQGVAFFRFFYGRYFSSLKFAEKAFQSAYRGNFLFGLAFSSELIGHSNCQIGEIHKGLKDFEKAIHYAKELGNNGLLHSFQIAQEKYKALYGTKISKTLENLTDAINNLKPENTYSRAELYLELSRQLVLRGKTTEAKQLLESNAETIYKHQNRRQSATFNLRYAHILLLQGEDQAALMLLRSAQSNLVKNVDNCYLSQLQGLEKKILRVSQGIPEEGSTNKKSSYIDKRILNRNKTLSSKETFISNQDIIGDYIDAAKNNRLDLNIIKKNQLLGLLPLLLNQKESSTFILLGPSRGEIFIYAKGDALWVPKGISSPMKKILVYLGSKDVTSKEDIIQTIWGYEYRPDRHDNLLHATIGKLRKLMGPFGELIEWSGNGYRFKTSLTLLETKASHREKLSLRPIYSNSILENEAKNDFESNLEELNQRQLRLLSKLKNDSHINVTQYSKMFKVCKMTACRDLSFLHKNKLLNKHGRARATSYCLRGNINYEKNLK